MSPSRRGDRAARQSDRLRWVVAFAAGGVLNLAFAPFAWWPIAIAAPAVLFALIADIDAGRACRVGACFGVGLFAFGTYWLYTCLHVFGLVPLWLTAFLQTALVALLASYVALLCYLANRIPWASSSARDWWVLPGLWMLLEWLRGWLLSGFPWLSLGYAFLDTPLAGLAPLVGVYGITWAAMFAAVALKNALTPHTAAPRRAQALVVMAVIFGVSALASQPRWTKPAGEKLPVAAVQGAIPQEMKWQLDNRDATMTRYLALTEGAWGARLIVWPEASLPVLAPEIADYLDNLQSLGRAHGADFALGLVDYWPASNQYFNGLLILGKQGDGWYYKRHLVPFGEYFPVPPFVRSWLRLLSLPYDDFTAGAPRQPTLSAAGQKLGLSICYEDSFGSDQLASLREATLLINVTNNAWFGDSTAPYQHLQMSRMRALEAGRFLIRATNDGITAVIGPRGDIVARLPQFHESVLRADVEPLSGLTPYARVGNYPVICAALVLLGAAVRRRPSSRQGSPTARA